MSEQDESIFEQYADHLERRAAAIVARWTAGTGVLGAFLGAVLMTPWADWPLHGMAARLVVLLGGVAGLVLGHSIGSARARGFQFQARLAEHQLRFEQTLARLEAAHRAVREPEPEPAPFAPNEVPVGMPPVTELEAPVTAPPPVTEVETPVTAPPPVTELETSVGVPPVTELEAPLDVLPAAEPEAPVDLLPVVVPAPAPAAAAAPALTVMPPLSAPAP